MATALRRPPLIGSFSPTATSARETEEEEEEEEEEGGAFRFVEDTMEPTVAALQQALALSDDDENDGEAKCKGGPTRVHPGLLRLKATADCYLRAAAAAAREEKRAECSDESSSGSGSGSGGGCSCSIDGRIDETEDLRVYLNLRRSWEREEGFRGARGKRGSLLSA